MKHKPSQEQAYLLHKRRKHQGMSAEVGTRKEFMDKCT